MAKLSIAVVGAGGIGSTFAFQLARAGHDVTAVARPGSPRLAQLQRDKAIVHNSGERAEVHIADALDESAPFDLVIVTTLAHQVDAFLPALQRSRAKWIQFMFNNFDPARLSQAVGAQRCSFGMPFVQATVDGDGKLVSTISRAQKTLHGDGRWSQLFASAGIPSAFEPEMQRWLRSHAPLCIGFESVSHAGVQRGGGASWAEAMRTARGVHGGFAIVEQLGEPLYPGAKKFLNAMPNAALALLFWSLSRVRSFRELLATGVNECRALIEVIAAAAEQRIPPPARAIEAVRAMKP